MVFLSLWFPEIKIYYVNTPVLSNQIIEESRLSPSNQVMERIAYIDSSVILDLPNINTIGIANRIIEGTLQIPGYTPIQINLPFDPVDLKKGSPTWKLLFSSLIAPIILLSAYEDTNDNQYFDLSRQMILSWADYEKSKWLPNGFLWNDHAIVGRVIALSKFWEVYRKKNDFDPRIAGTILEFVSRSGEMLAKKDHFTFATNHGIMQNLALLQIAAAFPALPRSDYFKQLGFERLQEQLDFYINDEGIILEHSAGYHKHGLMLIKDILELLDILNIVPASSWVHKYKKGQAFLERIRRPDGTLPIYGNTVGEYSPSSTYSLNKTKAYILDSGISDSLYPTASYSVWWSKLQSDSYFLPYSQTIVAWSYFLGHGHKLADEMSLLIWAGGQNWITNTGYWPYGVPGRRNVDSWEGSNAPHLLAESKNSVRETQLLNYVVENDFAMSHLRRTSPKGYSFDRQIMHLSPDLWVVIDSSSDQISRKSNVIWTFSPELNMKRGSLSNQYIIYDPRDDQCMTAFILGSEKIHIERHKGSKDPFFGWVVIGTQPKAASSLVVTQPSENSWTATILSLDKNCKGRFITRPQMLALDKSNKWSISLPLIQGAINIKRQDNVVLVDSKNAKIKNINLLSQNTHKVKSNQKIINNAFQSAANNYQRYNQDIYLYRVKITYILLAIFVLQEMFFLLLKLSRSGSSYQFSFRVISNSLWVVLGSFLFWYLAA